MLDTMTVFSSSVTYGPCFPGKALLAPMMPISEVRRSWGRQLSVNWPASRLLLGLHPGYWFCSFKWVVVVLVIPEIKSMAMKVTG